MKRSLKKKLRQERSASFDGASDAVFDPSKLALTGWWRAGYGFRFSDLARALSNLPSSFPWCVVGEADVGIVRVHFVEHASFFERHFVRELLRPDLASHVLLQVTSVEWCTKHDDCLHQRDNDHELGRACLQASL